MESLNWMIPVSGLLALIVALIVAKNVASKPVGNEKMQQVANAIHSGAKAFLSAQYKILIAFIIVVFLSLGFGLDNWMTAGCFLVGAGFSVLAGYCGMNVATKANVRTTNAAMESGLSKALSVAFSGGAVMGLCVVGLGLFGSALIYILTGNSNILFGFSLGASSVALFARVGGGVYTKAADVGADLVGKVERDIPEDDPRNPATIADNVGDNVGDVAGMGADLFESYVGSIISAITLGTIFFQKTGAMFPLYIAAIGICASIISTFIVKTSKSPDPRKALNTGTYVAGGLVMIGSIILSKIAFDNYKAAVAIIAGLVVGILIGVITEYFTSESYKPVRKIAQQAQTGSATTIISGLAVGMRSTCLPVLLIAGGILISYYVAGLYGVALAAVGMLSTTGTIVAVDAYGPIADNAGGIAEMSKLPESVRKVTDKLDAVGNTTAAIGKGFAIGSAALTALALLISYAQVVQLTSIDLLQPIVIAGLFVGAMLPFLFSALTMESVSNAAHKMVEEVRRQFREIPGILTGETDPDYKTCVAISTSAALREMIIPGILAIAVPLTVGILFGTVALGGMLCGATVTGVLLAIFMSNSGGAWDNAKKYVEGGVNGGKGSDTHKATIVGDTVGDPFKDTSGPSINILIKLMSVVALVFAPIFVKIGGLLM